MKPLCLHDSLAILFRKVITMTLKEVPKKVAEKDHHLSRRGNSDFQKKAGRGKYNRGGNEPDGEEIKQEIQDVKHQNTAKGSHTTHEEHVEVMPEK